MTPFHGECDSQWESVEGAFFAKGAEDDLAAIEQYEALAHRGRFRVSIPAWCRGALVLAGCASGILAVTFAAIRLAHRPAQAASSESHAGAPVAETPGSDSRTLMTSLPSGQNQVPSVAGAPARDPAEPKAEPVIVQAEAPAAEPQDKPQEMLFAQANEQVSQCRTSLQKQKTAHISGTCAAAMELDATLAKPLLAWAMSEFRHGRTGVVASWVRKIMQIDPTLADAYLILGVAEQGAAHTAVARQAYKRYLELSPQGAYAGEVRSSLRSM
jgi:hypothetical protein